MMNQPRVGLFCKSFKDDLEWLFYGLNSFKRNFRYENMDILVVTEPNCQPELTKWNTAGPNYASFTYIRAWPDGYTHAMAMKMCADIFMPEADLIWLLDSDMILNKPTSLDELLANEQPTLYYDDWNSDLDTMRRVVSKRIWAPAVLKSTGRTLNVDWMVCPVWLFWRSTFAGARKMIEDHWRMPFLQAVYSAQQYDWKQFMSHPMTFCDMQTLGIYASEYEAHKYNVKIRTPNLEFPVTQYWSHQPIDEVRGQLLP